MGECFLIYNKLCENIVIFAINWEELGLPLFIREAANDKVPPLMARPLRERERGVKAGPLMKKELFFEN